MRAKLEEETRKRVEAEKVLLEERRKREEAEAKAFTATRYVASFGSCRMEANLKENRFSF